MKRIFAVLLTLIVVGSQFSMAVPVVAEDSSPQADKPDRTVATLGEVIAVHGHTLTLQQEALQFKPAEKVKVKYSEHKLSVGYAGNHLQVIINDGTEIYIGSEPAALSDELVGMQVIVAGRLDGKSLKADVVTDLATLTRPPEDYVPYTPDPYSEPIDTSDAGLSATDDLSLCLGQDLDYDADPTIQEFQGCFGGPSATDDIDLPQIPVGCPLAGCFVVDRFLYDVALAGWGFAFPFQFSATSSDLTYHVPSPISLDVQPLPATEYGSTFWGGLGLDVAINFDFCWLDLTCDDLGTVWLGGVLPSMLHKSDGAAPLTGQTLDVDEVTCPSLGGIEIPNTPLSLVGIDLCEDLSFDGRPFKTQVHALGSAPLVSQNFQFQGAAQDLIIRPDALQVTAKFDNFWYVPSLNSGIYFDLNALAGTVSIYQTPPIPLAAEDFYAITTPFPYPGSLMTLATDPLSPITDLRYFHQPTEINFKLDVQPAPTRLSIISPNALAEGKPVEALLQEDYDGTPIAGETVTFTVGNDSVSVVTNESGIAQLLLPTGEYQITADFAGSDYYLASTASMGPIYIYRPTNFVIWGGTSGDVRVSQAYQFWGSQWWKQITGTVPRGAASFKGYARTVTETTWYNPPANSGNPPRTVPNLIGVIVTTRMNLRGKNLEGNVYRLAILEVKNPASYKPSPGYQAWGTLEALIP